MISVLLGVSTIDLVGGGSNNCFGGRSHDLTLVAASMIALAGGAHGNFGGGIT